jgi:regulator of cell morphogenesis and NO signaling
MSTTIDPATTVGQLVAQRPIRSKIFEKLGIDFCCGGKKPLEEVCQAKGLDPATVLAMLDALDATDEATAVDANAMTLTQLCDHIEQTHHAYLRDELPRLDFMTRKVAAGHGDGEPRLVKIREVFVAFANELTSHMFKEEKILFPIIRGLEAGDQRAASHCGHVGNPIRQMELEHDEAGAALEAFRTLSDGYTPPEWACNTFRAMYDALERLERDMHQHVHKENNVLFVKALKLHG